MAASNPHVSASNTFRQKNLFGLLAIALFFACFPVSSQIAAPAPDFSSDVLIKGLNTPWAIDFAPDGRIFITERGGHIRVLERGQLRPDPWMTLDVAASGEAGLLGLALDPRFAQNFFVYVAYTYRNASGKMQNRLVRSREDPKTGKGQLDKVLIDNIAAANNHDGGRVKFGPDGKLYWSMGDARGSIRMVPYLRIIPSRIPMSIPTVIEIRKDWPGNPRPDDCTQPNMAPAGFKAAAATK
ncbi:MAG: PQQ-dependent sugar dehydrogenase [Deltaproteobacteria bacterium]|nr:PQQ-dependent sugar dehydrogenase [Deltaproteobacteria bacterium]